MGAVEEFLKHLRKSGLVSPGQLDQTLRAVPPSIKQDPEALAAHLVRLDLITPFQSQKLLQRTSVGLIVGPYHIQAPIGKGGSGTVYLAFDAVHERHIALKVLPPRRAMEEDRLRARFQREMETSRLVDHPHIAHCYDAGVIGKIHYLALEYIPGQTLYRLVSKEGPLSVPRAARLFAEVANALTYAHGMGLIHRDLKPSNIMVTPKDHAKVLDLGLAFMTGENKEDTEVVGGKGYVVGSIDYMAPEQTRDPTAVDGRSDLYAVGCCLYFALTGKPPFPKGSFREKVLAHRNSLATLIQNMNPLIPGGFAAIVHRLLEKEPVHRFTSAAQLEAELRKWCEPEEADASVDVQGDAGFEAAVRTAATSTSAELTEDSNLFALASSQLIKPRELRKLQVWSLGLLDALDDNQRRALWLALLVGMIWMSCCLLSTCALWFR